MSDSAAAGRDAGLSAIDIALWDLFGQATGQPIHQLLGGLSHDRVRTYNTCAGYSYVRSRLDQVTGQWQPKGAVAEGPYEDFEAFLTHADELASSLLEQGITGMKIWPFDDYAAASKGCYISGPDLDRALEPSARSARRSAIAWTSWSSSTLWNLPTAKRIMAALEEFDPFWFEDPIRMNNADALAELASSTRVPITASETLATRFAYREFISRGGSAS
jgi:L-alanine-DL-glutamate epimerase and related enzymes of enolase superfamily